MSSTNRDTDLVITRRFNAPRELVFKAWTEPEHIVRWWGPKGCSVPSCTVDLRVGGEWHYCMRTPEGIDFWVKQVFLEIERPSRLVFDDFFVDGAGNKVHPSHYGLSQSWPLVLRVTVTFEEDAGQTVMTVRQSVGDAPPQERAGTDTGWNESFDRLEELLPAL